MVRCACKGATVGPGGLHATMVSFVSIVAIVNTDWLSRSLSVHWFSPTWLGGLGVPGLFVNKHEYSL